jgi:hypothetical protein
MSDRVLRSIGTVFLTAGFFLWAYGFVYSSFWYANPDASIIEPARVWLSDNIGRPVPPGTVEKVLGLAAALSGVLLQFMSYREKR